MELGKKTNLLVSDILKILCVDKNNTKLQFNNISECNKFLKIDRQTIKKYLMIGEKYKNYKFYFVY